MNDRELITTRILAADPAVVFDVWTDPEHLTHWWGPSGFRTTTHAMELRAGGVWRFAMHGPDGKDYPNESTFAAIEEPRRVAIDHRSEPRFLAEFLFTPVAQGTRITFYHTFQSAKVRERIQRLVGTANEENLDRLQDVLGCPAREGAPS